VANSSGRKGGIGAAAEADFEYGVPDLGSVPLTDAELCRGLGWWAGGADGFDPWLGERREAA
jgi:hypothetical protein